MLNKRAAKTGSPQIVIDLLRISGPQTQASIARATGLSPATVNNVIQMLKEEGVVEVNRINGRDTAVSLISRTGILLAITLGHEGFYISTFDFLREKRANFKYTVGALENSPIELVNYIRKIINISHFDETQISGIVVAIKAPISSKTGCIQPWATNRMPAWANVSIINLLSEQFNVPVFVENDANLATFAEWTWGSGTKSDNFINITCSSQIGGGIVIGGRIFKGANGMAGEFGHVVIDDNGPICFCGSRGCLSSLISERALIRKINLDNQYENVNSLSDIINLSINNDAACQRLIRETGRYLGYALANIAKIFAPQIISIGGSLSRASDTLFQSINNVFIEQNLDAVSPGISLVASELSDDAIVLGSAAYFLAENNQGISELPDWMQSQI